jgi:hypothetical protein
MKVAAALKRKFSRRSFTDNHHDCRENPLWWFCYDPQSSMSYEEIAQICQSAPSVYYDLIDLGDLDYIDRMNLSALLFGSSTNHSLIL